jgi:DNA-binding XRE family transcriptional regulator
LSRQALSQSIGKKIRWVYISKIFFTVKGDSWMKKNLPSGIRSAQASSPSKMASDRRKGTQKLPIKLLKIREALGLSQNGLISMFGLEGHTRQQISAYESGKYEPSLSVLLKYSEAANICLDVLVSDKHSLPNELPAKVFYHPHQRS